MSEPPTPSPAPAPPVSRWERLAAGVLVLMLGVTLYGGWLHDAATRTHLRYMVANMQETWMALFALRSVPLSEWMADSRLYTAVDHGLWLAVFIGNILLLPFAAGRALGWKWLTLWRFFWGLVLAHGSLVIAQFAILWFQMARAHDQTIHPPAIWPSFRALWLNWWLSPWAAIYFAEFLLAAVLLVLTRRKTSQGLPGSV